MEARLLGLRKKSARKSPLTKAGPSQAKKNVTE